VRLLLPLVLVLIPSLVQADVVFDGLRLTAQTIATGLDSPLYLTAPAGDPRLFVVEKTGRIRIIKNGILLPEPFLDISDQISTNSERGLLGLAFSPDYGNDHRFFIYFTDPEGTIHLAALTATGDRADPASLKSILSIPHPEQGNHNGGWISFGPDGDLYIGTGDGGGSGDKPGNAQNPNMLLGKMLRIDVRTDPYAIPPGNPFAQDGGAPEVFFTGLRNPWRNSFDGETLYIADVGQDKFEELNITQLTPGLNFGWNRMEGDKCFGAKTCDTTGLTPPTLVYDHSLGCSITGGYVYRGQAMPALQGRYFYGDYCTGEIMSLRYSGETVGSKAEPFTLQPLTSLTSFGQDASGELYMVFGDDGSVAKIIAKN